MPVCVNCNQERDATSFTKRTWNRFKGWCDVCMLERTITHRKRHEYKKRYGYTVEAVEALWQRQGGYCAVCGRHGTPCV